MKTIRLDYDIDCDKITCGNCNFVYDNVKPKCGLFEQPLEKTEHNKIKTFYRLEKCIKSQLGNNN